MQLTMEDIKKIPKITHPKYGVLFEAVYVAKKLGYTATYAISARLRPKIQVFKIAKDELAAYGITSCPNKFLYFINVEGLFEFLVTSQRIELNDFKNIVIDRILNHEI